MTSVLQCYRPHSLKWIYVLDEDFEWQSPYGFGTKGMAFNDQNGKRRLELLPGGRIRVLSTYAWDGCSPKFSVFDIVVGTPDGVPNSDTKKPKTYYASLVHDVLYQFLDAGVPLRRSQVDGIFLKIMTEHHFALRRLYYFAVRLFGGFYRVRLLTNKKARPCVKPLTK